MAPQIRITMPTMIRTRAPNQLGFLLDELRSAGVTTYADLAASLNRRASGPVAGDGKPMIFIC